MRKLDLVILHAILPTDVGLPSSLSADPVPNSRVGPNMRSRFWRSVTDIVHMLKAHMPCHISSRSARRVEAAFPLSGAHTPLIFFESFDSHAFDKIVRCRTGVVASGTLQDIRCERRRLRPRRRLYCSLPQVCFDL